MHDILCALRTTIRRPALPLVVTLLFALGIGMATGLWAVVDAAFLRPLPYPDADRLVVVLETHPERGPMAVTPANFLDWSERVPAFRGSAATVTSDASLSVADRPGVVVAAMGVTGSLFPVLGGDVRQPLGPEPRAEAVLYLPYQQNPWPYMTFMFAAAASSAAAVAAVREELHALDPTLAAGPAHPLGEMRTAWLDPPRLRARIVSIFAAATLALTLVGLSVRVAHGVVVRQRELAIRQALGASPATVVRMVTRETLLVMLAGAVAALIGLPGARLLLGGALPGAGPLTAVQCLMVALAVGAAGTCCGYLPARRAGRIPLLPLLKRD